MAESFGTPGRTESFMHGVNGTPQAVASSLDEESAQFNAQVPHGYQQTSVLQQVPGMSGNGMSDADFQRKIPGGPMLPSSNGMSSGSYDQSRYMMLNGKGAW